MTKALNTKHEIRSTKQYQMTKIQNSKQFETFRFRIWDLFRISDLGFRILLICIISGFLLSIQAIAAENNAIQKITTITSNRMEMDWSKNVAIFIGNALLVDEDGMVEADRMEVFLVTSEEDESKEDIDKVIATGNVKITTPDRKTKSGKAVFHKKKDILILTDNPEVWQKGTCFTGGRITFDLKKDTMIIDKDVQGSIESSKEKDADITDKKSH